MLVYVMKKATIAISSRIFEPCPISGKTREVVCRFPVLRSAHLKAHVLTIHGAYPMPTENILASLDRGDTRGSFVAGNQTVVWEVAA